MAGVAQSKIKKYVEQISAALPPSENLEKISKVKDITTFNDFQFLNEHVVAYKQWKIGKSVTLDNLNLYENFPAIIVLKTECTQEVLKPFKPTDASIPANSNNVILSKGHSIDITGKNKLTALASCLHDLNPIAFLHSRNLAT